MILASESVRTCRTCGQGLGEEVKVKVEIDYDPDSPDPIDNDRTWELVQFNPRFKHYQDPTDIDQQVLKERVLDKTAFIVSVHDHGDRDYGLLGEVQQDMWDTTKMAGVLYLVTPEDLGDADRVECARSVLNVYSEWARGNVYQYALHDAETGEMIDSCGGYLLLGSEDEEYFLSEIKEHVPEGATIVRVIGGAADSFAIEDLIGYEGNKE